ncbi:MAG: class I SAM-dependent methyltransferase [Pyrinomonadaceae bacterium]
MPEAALSNKSAKELAYLHDLYVATDWSERFAELVDKNIKLPDDGQFLYVEAGTGNHVIELRGKLDEKVEVFGTESDAERLNIAQAKSKAVNAPIHFQNSYPHKLNFPDAAFGTVICDASFLATTRLLAVWQELFRVVDRKGNVAFVLPTAGSFGEFFSIYWEALYALEMTEMAAEIENLINNLPTISDVEDVAANAGFKKIEVNTSTELFEFETGDRFLRSPLISDFLFPTWTGFVPEAKQVKLMRTIEKVINDSNEGHNFLLTVKMTLVTATKN